MNSGLFGSSARTYPASFCKAAGRIGFIFPMIFPMAILHLATFLACPTAKVTAAEISQTFETRPFPLSDF
jgi:hypothetical protein